MALHSIKKIGKSGKIGIWQVTEGVEELFAQKLFSELDLLQATSFSNDNRKKEWLVSRVLVRELTGGKSREIYYDEHKKPYLKQSSTHISISHSNELQVLVVDNKPTGIDIEKIAPQILGIKNKFMSDSELHLIGTDHEIEKLTLCWCAKEALYKYYGKKQLVFKEHLMVHSFSDFTSGYIKASIYTPEGQVHRALQCDTIVVGHNRFMLVCILHED